MRVPDHADILAMLAGGAVAHLRFSSVTALAFTEAVARSAALGQAVDVADL